MPVKAILLFFTLFFSQVTWLFAQGKYRAIHWGYENGLSSENHNEMLKDKNGFLWVGSYNGLNRFDGSNFRHYIPEKNNPGSIMDGGITNLIEDSLHNIWVGSLKGLSRYDIKADTFKNFPATHLVYTFVIPFFATAEKLYCLEGGWTLTEYDIHSFKKKLLADLPAPGYIGGDDESYHSFYDAGSKTIWLPQSYVEGQSKAGLLRLSLVTGKRDFYTWPCFSNIPGHIHRIKDMRYDQKRNLVWISSSDGLLKFTLDDQQFHPVVALNKPKDALSSADAGGVDIDPQGLVWWCSWPAGPVVYDPSRQSVTPVFPDIRQQHQIALANLYVYCDPGGMVWTSCYEGSRGIYQIVAASAPVVNYTGDTSQPQHLLNGNSVSGIALGEHGYIWISQGDELNIFDPVTSKFMLVSSEKDLPAFHGKQISPVNIDSIHQKALFDLWDQNTQKSEMYEMDTRTRKCRPVVFKDSAGRDFDPPAQYNVYPFKDGALLFSSFLSKLSTHGIYWVNTDSAIARWIGPIEENEGSAFGTDNDHLVFLQGLNNRTFSLVHNKWTPAKSAVDSLHWSAICYDKKSNSYWVGVDDSLLHFDNALHIIRRYFIDGILYGDGILGLSPDDSGHIWVRHARSALWMDTATGKITALTEDDGFKKRPLGGGPVAIGHELYFWGNGLDRVNPAKLSRSYPASIVYFKSLEINQKPFFSSAGINELNSLSLRYNENKISIETGIIDYYTRAGSRIRYKIEELGGAWQFAPAGYTIRYEGLSPGTYTLAIQASNASGDFNGPEKKLVFNLSPPFWQTWWFRTISVLVFVCLLYGFYRWRTASLHRQRRILEQTVTERTSQVLSQKKEIEVQRDQVTLALNELQSAQRQLIQSEKMASLGELTAGIAHEIQNPLNFVNNFSDLNRELADELQTELRSGNTAEAISLSNDIKANEEKINHHGRRAAAIVKGMLEHSRSSTGVKEATAVNALADEYLRLAYRGLRGKDSSFNATIKTDFDESIGKIKIIPQDIGRVFLNLFTNAFYAVAEKRKIEGVGFEPTVTVSTKKSGSQVFIAVRDNGNGIPENIADKIFQPFFTTKPTGSGTGLGLSLAYDIVKAHGGELKLDTKENEYAEFVVTLPA